MWQVSLFEWITGPATTSLKHRPRTPSGNTDQDTERKGGTQMLRNGLEPWHLLIVAIVVIALFGSKKAAGHGPRPGQIHADPEE